MELELKEFLDYKLKRLINEWGFDDGEKSKKLLIAMLVNKKYNPNLTFLELYKITKIKFTVVITNLTKHKPEYINYKNNPNTRLVDIIRISTSYPLIYSPVKMNNNVYLDGGLLSSYPIEYFKNKKNVYGFVVNNIENDKRFNINNIADYFMNIITSLHSKNEKEKIKKYFSKTIFIDKNKLNCNSMDYNITTEKKENLFKFGVESYLKYKEKYIL